MHQLELTEYAPYAWNGPLDRDQRRALTEDAKIEVTLSPAEGGAYILKPSSYVGAVNIGDLSVVVRPKIPIDRVMFLIAYAMDPKTWRQGSVALERDDGVLEAIALAFARHTQRAIQRGLLQGYRREEDALNTVRGRIRFGDQIGRRFGIPLPIEVAFDEFTEDIEENRLLKTAIHRLGHTFIRSDQIRREVRSLRPAFTTVGLGSYRRGAAPVVRYTRLNDHYRPAVELARLIIENSSLELLHGKVAEASLLIDMNMVFERFLYVALREELKLSASEWRHEERLDPRRGVSTSRSYPDLSWWSRVSDAARFVGDAKYKKLDASGFRHADIYQMLAYCTAADLPSGLLVYAAGQEDTPGTYKIKHAGKTIEVASLDLEGTPEDILGEVRGLAARVRAHRHEQPARLAA